MFPGDNLSGRRQREFRTELTAPKKERAIDSSALLPVATREPRSNHPCLQAEAECSLEDDHLDWVARSEAGD